MPGLRAFGPARLGHGLLAATAAASPSGGLALYPSFSRSRIMWPGGDFNEPTLPQGSLTTVTATNDSQFASAMSAGSRQITVPTGTALGAFNGTVGNDIEVVIQSGASVLDIQIGSGARIRVRGPGKAASLGCSRSDVVFDGLVLDPEGLNYYNSGNTTIGVGDCSRVAFLNIIARAKAEQIPPTAIKPCLFFALGAVQDLLVANCNWAVPSGGSPGDARWCVRLENLDGTRAAPMQRQLWLDCMQQTEHESFRFSGGGSSGTNGLIQKVQCDGCWFVNTASPNAVFHSQDESPIWTNYVYLRSCTTVMGDSQDTGGTFNFGPTPNFMTFGAPLNLANDALVYAVDHHYIGRVTGCVTAAQLASIEASAASFGWDCHLRGTAANPSATNGASFSYDTAVPTTWATDGSATGWRQVVSALVGAVGPVSGDPYDI